MTPRLLNPLMCGPESARWTRVDFDARHQLGFFDRLFDRIDRRLEVDDHAAPDTARFGDAETDDVEAVAFEQLADDGRHLRRADVETDQVSLFARHATPPACVFCRAEPAPDAAPASGRAARGAGRAPRFPALPARPHVHAVVEPQVDVVDVGHALAERFRQLQVRLQPLQELVFAQPDHGWILIEDDAGVVHVGHVDLRQAFAQVRSAVNRTDDARRQLRARFVRRPVIG